MKPQRKWVWAAVCGAAVVLSGCVVPPPPHDGPGPRHDGHHDRHDRYDRDGRPGDGWRGGPPPGAYPGRGDGRRNW